MEDPERQNEDGSYDLLTSAGTKEVKAEPLLVFKTWEQAATFMALWGAQHQPMKRLPGENSSKRVYVCRHPTYSRHGSGYLKRKRSGVESSGGAASSSASGHGTCDAFFCFQRVRAQSLVDGTWHRSQYSRRAYGGGGDDGESEAESEATQAAVPKDENSNPPKRQSNSLANHTYTVPQLKKLPMGCASTERVIALTCFKTHTDHPSEVSPSEIGSTSTNTQNVASSAGGLGQNNTCRCCSLPAPAPVVLKITCTE